MLGLGHRSTRAGTHHYRVAHRGTHDRVTHCGSHDRVAHSGAHDRVAHTGGHHYRVAHSRGHYGVAHRHRHDRVTHRRGHYRVAHRRHHYRVTHRRVEHGDRAVCVLALCGKHRRIAAVECAGIEEKVHRIAGKCGAVRSEVDLRNAVAVSRRKHLVGYLVELHAVVRDLRAVRDYRIDTVCDTLRNVFRHVADIDRTAPFDGEVDDCLRSFGKHRLLASLSEKPRSDCELTCNRALH